MDVWKVCPQLIVLNKEKTLYTGFINATPGRQYRVQIELRDRQSLKGARLKCEWSLQNLLKGYGNIIQQRLNQASSLASFLKELKTIIEKRLDDVREPVQCSAVLCGQLLSDIEHLGWDRLTSVDPNFKQFQLKAVDDSRRSHILKVQLHPQHPEGSPTCLTDLPQKFEFQWSSKSRIRDLYDQFVQCLQSYQDFWDQVGEIDRNTWVLEPEKPMYSVTHRRVALSANVSVQISVDPVQPRLLPECRFLGSDQAVQPLQESFNKNLHLWDSDQSLLSNLQRLLNQEFPSPAATRKEDFNAECGICYAYRLDTEIPDRTCDDPRCGQPFHSVCLYEWLRGLPSSRQSFNTIFGECPYCSKPITVKMPTGS